MNRVADQAIQKAALQASLPWRAFRAWHGSDKPRLHITLPSLVKVLYS